MADITELKNSIRIGTVQSIDPDKMTARVKFDDKGGVISAPLHIIKRPVYVIPAEKSKTRSKTAEAMSHQHAAYVSLWVPEVNDMVLCIMQPDGDGDGYVIGEV